MKFSVITISYNHAEFIEKTITSVLDQQYSDFEHIIIDGGSTDNSVEIFKKYPHLIWVSEKDSGLSNALNKGMKKATGDVIAWINSDDFYQPGAFQAVADAMNGHNIVLGDSYEADRQGSPIKLISNIGRNIYDLEKYWIPKAWLSQPSVFFTRTALESVRLPNSDYLDETFNYSMDFDLWLRLAEKYSFLNYIAKPLSSFRVYGDNLTGKTFASPQRELGRAFRKSYSNRFHSERPLEIIIPVQSLDSTFGKLLDQLLHQDALDFQITIVDRLTNPEEAKVFKKFIQEIEESTTLVNFRYIKPSGKSFTQSIKDAFDSAVGNVITLIPSDAAVSKEFTTKLLNIFAHDANGAVALIHEKATELLSQVCDTASGLLNINGLLNLKYEYIPFAIRRGILTEINVTNASNSFCYFASILLRTISKGWITPVEKMSGLQNTFTPRSGEIEELFTAYQRGALYMDLFSLEENDSFSSIRKESGYAPQLDEKVYQSIKGFFSTAPIDWFTYSSSSSEAALAAIVKEFPMFGPAWYFLAKKLKETNNLSTAQEAFQIFKKIRPETMLTL